MRLRAGSAPALGRDWPVAARLATLRQVGDQMILHPAHDHVRNAVTLRDRHCRFPGGCNQPASACEVHHTKHKANGGPTSVKDCVLLYWFHHQVVIHRWGWTLVLNPDGTTTAWNKDKTKVLHSHGPPARAG